MLNPLASLPEGRATLKALQLLGPVSRSPHLNATCCAAVPRVAPKQDSALVAVLIAK
jgi:hypothetical protein